MSDLGIVVINHRFFPAEKNSDLNEFELASNQSNHQVAISNI